MLSGPPASEEVNRGRGRPYTRLSRLLHFILIKPRDVDQMRRQYESTMTEARKLSATIECVNNLSMRVKVLERQVTQLQNLADFHVRIQRMCGDD